MKFYLGTHLVHWLRLVEFPLFISRRRLAGRKTLPPATCDWALDSGGFSELSMYGEWRTDPARYVDEVNWFMTMGRMDWAAVQDWMCEPPIRAKTGKTTYEHQRRTVDSYLDLSDRAPEIPWTPVLQGWEPEDYYDHVRIYESAGIDLRTLPTVGVGSVCRRQATDEVVGILAELNAMGFSDQLHGFGFKIQGVQKASQFLKSSDSLAWSYGARRSPRLPECEGSKHKNCANCLKYATQWREKVIRAAS